MRIIGGKYRGKNLISPEKVGVRPTADRTREAMFNILRSRLAGNFSDYTALDVFSGTGALGLEALSQGVKEVCLLDIDTKAILKNVALFPNEKNTIKIIKADATKLMSASKAYDLLFMDAPYKKALSEQALQQLAKQGWLTDEALCLIEIERDEKICLPENYELLDERCYGAAKVLIAEFKA